MYGVHVKYYPEREIAVISIEMESSPEYPLTAAKLLVERGIRLLSCIISSHPKEPFTQATLFLDFTETATSVKTLVEEFQKSPGVKRVEFSTVPLTWGEARLVAFTLRDICELFGAMHKWGPAGQALLYHMGFAAGERKASEFAALYAGEAALRYLLLWMESLGWGSLEIAEYRDGEYCKIEVQRLFECICGGDELAVPTPRSHLFRGLLAGFLSKLWGKKVQVAEVECIAQRKPCCIFEARPE